MRKKNETNKNKQEKECRFISHREQIYGLEMYFKKNHLNVLKFYVLKKITTESLKLDRPPPFSVCNYQSPWPESF